MTSRSVRKRRFFIKKYQQEQREKEEARAREEKQLLALALLQRIEDEKNKDFVDFAKSALINTALKSMCLNPELPIRLLKLVKKTKRKSL